MDTNPRLQTLHLRLTREFGEVLERGTAPENLRPGMNLQVPGLAQNMERALSAYEAPEAFRNLALQSAAFAAAILILDPQAARLPAGASSLTARRRRALMSYVDENLAGDVTLLGIADAVGLSPRHFTRVFKAATGVTPYAWVVGRRIERVKQLLVRGDLPLAGVARHCGFATQSHMTDVFRRTIGITPGRWRVERGEPHKEDDTSGR